MHKKVKERIEKIERELKINSYKKWLENKYLVEMKTTRMISKELYGKPTNSTTVIYDLKLFDIPIRHGSEAVKTQWLNNTERKRKSAVIASKYMGVGTPSRERLKKTMQTDEYREKQRIAHLGNKNGMFGKYGELSSRWNPNRTKEQRILERKTSLDRIWRNSVFQRDEYMCKACGNNKGGNLVAHHINSYHWAVEDRYNVNNGITLCESCHKDFHSKYSYFNNNQEQMDEYLNHSVMRC
ncbi:HNH endonuclease [Staphylococcus hominis]|uniref:HNH endonuclease n=1 Tax=Staphylococcus hominis TaxID=1290 RepID=UPI003CFCE830